MSSGCTKKKIWHQIYFKINLSRLYIDLKNVPGFRLFYFVHPLDDNNKMEYTQQEQPQTFSVCVHT